MRYFRLLFYSLIEFLHLYLAWGVYRAFRNRRLAWLAAIIPVLPLMALYGRGYIRQYIASSTVMQGFYYWIGFLLLMVITLIARDLLHVITIVVDKLVGTTSRKWLSGTRSVRVALCLGVVGFFYSLYEAKAVHIQNLVVKTSKLPNGVDRIRLAVLADMHLTRETATGEIEGIVALTNSAQPDYILAVGDYLDGRLQAGGREAQLLQQLEARRGKYAVHGNHELYRGLDQAEAFITSAGFSLLRGETVDLPELVIAGVDDPQIATRREIVDTLADAVSGKFVLLLSHRPEAPPEAIGEFDLQVSGHTHGGQVWPGRYLQWIINGFDRGLTDLTAPTGNRSLVYVSNGVRFWGPPVRFLTPPEITIIDVERE